MIFGFFKKLIKYYIDKLVDWMRMVKFDLELENEIKEFHEDWLKENAKEKPKKCSLKRPCIPKGYYRKNPIKYIPM